MQSMRRSTTRNNEESRVTAKSCAGLLGDTPSRDYSRKLHLFNAFAEPELRSLIVGVDLKPGMRILDAGCGTGEALPWLLDEVSPTGGVIGLDLATAHVEAPIAGESIDFIWCVNTINHLRDPAHGVEQLAALLRPGGRIALGQSSLLPDMYFAWDSRLERVTNEAVHRYYHERYSLNERDLSSVRALVGLLRQADFQNVTARTVLIERVSPLDAATERYLLDTIFKNTWGERLRPFLSDDDYSELLRVCNPLYEQFALRRPDFHFLQSLTLVTGDMVSRAGP
jgi:SAM-dependent methyltransferase